MDKGLGPKETNVMSDQTVDYEETAPAGGEEQVEVPVTEADMISRGKGKSLDAIEEGSPAAVALEEFRQTVEAYDEAEAAFEALKAQRNAQILELKDKHDVGFSAIAEVVGNTSSLVLYMYQRAQGKTAKEIREESKRSRLAKEQFRESDPDRKPARKQSAEEKAFRAQQKEALQAFLESEKAKAASEAGGAEGE